MFSNFLSFLGGCAKIVFSWIDVFHIYCHFEMFLEVFLGFGVLFYCFAFLVIFLVFPILCLNTSLFSVD